MNSQNTNIFELKALLIAHADLPLLFKLDDETINAGYHVTEIKHAVVNAMDCGQGTEQWDELIVQLLDGSALYKGEHMNCGKFMGIVSTAVQAQDIDENTLTYIEFSPNNKALKKLVIDSVVQNDSNVTVHLSAPTAMCKPFQRAMTNQPPKESCCGGEEVKKPDVMSCC